ncbi:MAG: hypothetical protein Q9225_005132 [Loekoesia sp. 1 TL-2023]
MQLSLFLFWIAAFEALPILGYTYVTSSLCKTFLGPKSTSPVKTSSYALTIPVTYVKKTTITPTNTITPPPVTTTTTTTSTLTSTRFTATTITSTVVRTSTPPATTVATSPGFTPLASGIGYRAKKRSIEDVKAAAPAIRGRTVQERAPSSSGVVVRCSKGGPPHFAPAQYPTSVICGALVQAVTTTTKSFTATTTATTTLAPVTETATSTTIETTTSTSTYPAITETTTTTVSTTTITTTTRTLTTDAVTTQTIVAPAPTTYNACAPNNVVNSANGGQGIDGVGVEGGVIDVSAADAVACCTACQTSAYCFGYVYSGGSRCYLTSKSNQQCAGNAAFGSYYTSSTLSPSDGFVIGNGPCGQLMNNGGS